MTGAGSVATAGTRRRWDSRWHGGRPPAQRSDRDELSVRRSWSGHDTDPVPHAETAPTIASVMRSATSSGDTVIHTFNRLCTSDPLGPLGDPFGSVAL
jgi:hypothetical protein